MEISVLFYNNVNNYNIVLLRTASTNDKMLSNKSFGALSDNMLTPNLTHPFIHSFIHSFTDSLTQTHSMTLNLTHSLNHSISLTALNLTH